MGYTVFPLHTVRDGRCGCGDEQCGRTGKHPRVRWSLLAPGEQISGDAGHGIATGARSGIFVVDTDTPEADARYRDACEAEGAGLDTYTVRTPKGGRHYYYAWPGFPVRNTVGRLLLREDDPVDPRTERQTSKIDTRGDGGFVVMAGSPHKNGGTYQVEINAPPARAPVFVLEWTGLEGRDAGEPGENAPTPIDLATDEGQRRLSLGRQACAEFPPSIEGQDGSGALWNLALRLIRELEIPLDTAGDLVLEIFNPRCEPAWDPDDVAHKLEDARDKSDRRCGIAPASFHAWVEKRATLLQAACRAPGTENSGYECSLGDVAGVDPGKTSIGEVLAVLSTHPSWAGVLAYDEFRDVIVARAPREGSQRPIKLEAERSCFVDRDVTAIRKWFECQAHVSVSKDSAWEAAVAVARENGFHPVRDYLASLDPEPEETLNHAARAFFGSDDPFDAMLVRKFMIAAVRRILRPGEKVDSMLVLVGAQGTGKSTFVPALFGEEFSSEDLADIRTKDAMIGLQGQWAIEVAELDKMLRADPESVKAFVSRCVDPYRAPYERVTTKHPRQCVYVGTTNKDDFLRDPTGERRYWIIDVRQTGGVDLEEVRALRDVMWSAAFTAAQRSKSEVMHWLTREEGDTLARRARAYKGEHPWTLPVLNYCKGRDFVAVADVLKGLGVSTDRHDQKTSKPIENILRELGCESGGQFERREGYRVRLWRVPEDLRASKVPAEEALKRTMTKDSV